MVFETLDELEDHNIRYRYGRQGTPLTTGLEDVISELEAAEGTVLTPSGLAAICVALSSCLSSGDELLVTDSVYEPTRIFCETMLKRQGITIRYFDPRIGADIGEFVSERTRAIFLESPGSLTFELQDIPAIVAAVDTRDITILVDNSWATPLYCNPLSLGADIVIHSGTKMFAGHSDVMIGTASANAKALPALRKTHRALGQIASPDDAFLTMRGMRTLSVRMKEHQSRALELAAWLERRSDGMKVLHPGLESHSDHAIFQRDFSGSGSLFSIILPQAPREAIAAMVDDMALFGMGYSWGGFESLILPSWPRKIRTATPWNEPGNLFRIHVGFEDIDELKADLDSGLKRYFSILGM